MQDALDNYHATLLSIWKSSHTLEESGFEFWPLLSSPPMWKGVEVNDVEVVTLGLNPSYVHNVLEKHWKEAQNEHNSMLEKWPGALKWDKKQSDESRKEFYDAVLRLDRYSREAYNSYYAPIKELVCLAGKGNVWYHMDVFPLRETNQKDFISKIPIPKKDKEKVTLDASKLISKSPKSYEWGSAMSKLFDACIELINDLQPTVVVVLNSYVSRMLEHRLELQVQSNGHRYESDKLPEVVFLLGSQLSGGATSIYGKERLLADLRDVVRGNNGLDGGKVRRGQV
ncbi:MAG: hypothetical protein EOO88_30525 [Pedobacter sp.]|nr:MAG: hypothetical protein EOO88_30525 [Pedobacter sp.]